MKIKIICESTADVPKDYAKENDIEIVPLLITMGDESHFDGVDIDSKDLFDFADKTNTLPKTAARSIYEYQEVFQKYLKTHDAIVYVGFSSELSSSFSNALIASHDFENVFCIDSKNLSGGQALLVMKAVEMSKRGMKPEEIKDRLEKLVEKVKAFFIVDTMRYLRMGGRCSMIAAIGATLLKIKPMIYLKDGKMVVGKKYMDRIDTALKKLAGEIFAQDSNIDTSFAIVTSPSSEKNDIVGLREKLITLGFKNVIIAHNGATIACHCGPETGGIFYMDRENL